MYHAKAFWSIEHFGDDSVGLVRIVRLGLHSNHSMHMNKN